jgi:hypothetical protein
MASIPGRRRGRCATAGVGPGDRHEAGRAGGLAIGNAVAVKVRQRIDALLAVQDAIGVGIGSQDVAVDNDPALVHQLPAEASKASMSVVPGGSGSTRIITVERVQAPAL